MKLLQSVAFAALVIMLGASCAHAEGSIDPVIDPVNGFLSNASSIQHTRINDGWGSIRIAAGTTAYSQYIKVNGRLRRYVVLRPVAPAPNAPVLLLLHPFVTSPETVADLSQIADYVTTQGFWAVLPEGTGLTWDQSTVVSRNSDIPFISALIDSLVANDGVDATRIYAAGFSDGGFFSEILACTLSDKIAGFGIDAATLRSSQVDACGTPARLRSKIYFLGTADPIVFYYGLLGNFPGGQRSADGTLQFWAQQQACGGVVANTLPNLAPYDGTTVQQTQYTGCASGTALQLYTIFGGGHVWPGGDPTFLGRTTKDIQATGLIWQFVRDLRR